MDLFVLCVTCVCELFDETIRNIFGCGCYFVVESYESEHRDVYFIGFVCVCRNSSFRSLRAGSPVFALLMLFLCVILHNMWSSKSQQLLCILLFGILCVSAIRMMFVKIQLSCVCW